MDLLVPVAQEGLKVCSQFPDMQNLRTLRLVESSLTPSTVSRLLIVSPVIARLEYDYSFNYNNDFECADLTMALNHVRLSLKYFIFACHVWSGESIGPEEIEAEFVIDWVSFADFPELEILHISPCILFGWVRRSAPSLDRVLPHQLRHLHLHNEFNEFELFEWKSSTLTEYLAKFLDDRNWNQDSYQLRVISVTNKYYWFSASQYQVLDAICQQHDLNFCLV